MRAVQTFNKNDAFFQVFRKWQPSRLFNDGFIDLGLLAQKKPNIKSSISKDNKLKSRSTRCDLCVAGLSIFIVGIKIFAHRLVFVNRRKRETRVPVNTA